MNRMGVLPAFVLVALAALPLGCQAVAGPREPMTISAAGASVSRTLDEVIAKADAIVLGDVTGAAPPRWNTPDGKEPPRTAIGNFPLGSIIFVDWEFRPSQILKGDLLQPEVRIRTFGGQIGEMRMIVEDETDLELGQQYLLFLFRNTGSTQDVEPGAYLLASYQHFYRIVDGKAISLEDERPLDDLLNYIETRLSTSP